MARIENKVMTRKDEFKDKLGSSLVKSAQLLDESLDVALDLTKTVKAVSSAIRREVEEF